MDKRAAELVANIVGATPVQLPDGDWQLLWPDADGSEKLVSFTFDKPVAAAQSTPAPGTELGK